MGAMGCLYLVTPSPHLGPEYRLPIPPSFPPPSLSWSCTSGGKHSLSLRPATICGRSSLAANTCTKTALFTETSSWATSS